MAAAATLLEPGGGCSAGALGGRGVGDGAGRARGAGGGGRLAVGAVAAARG